MGIRVRSKWWLLVLVAGLAFLALMVPAQAASVTPTVVAGASTCSPNSAAPLSLTLSAPIRSGTYPGQNGVKITVALTNNRGTAFNFSVEGGFVFDVIVKGNDSNWYDYDVGSGDPVAGDTSLTIPNGNKLNLVHFCYAAGVPIECGDPIVTSDDEGTTGIFTRVGGVCTEDKFVVIDVVDDTIVFIPSGGSPGGTTYLGTLTFTKGSADANALVLLYDRLDNGVFTPVPDCDDGQLPEEGADTWCVVSASAAYQGNSSWEFTWDVYGEGDPKFK